MDYGYYLAMEGVISMAKGKELQETRKQGTPMHPLKIYQMYDINGKIDVPYHLPRPPAQIAAIAMGK